MAAKVRSREPRRRVVLPIRPPPTWLWSTMRPSPTSIRPTQMVGEPEAVAGPEGLQVLQRLRERQVVVGDAEAEGQLGAGAFHRPERDP